MLIIVSACAGIAAVVVSCGVGLVRLGKWLQRREDVECEIRRRLDKLERPERRKRPSLSSGGPDMHRTWGFLIPNQS